MPRKFTLNIDCGGAAFDDDTSPELRRLLELVLYQLSVSTIPDACYQMGSLMDINGNTVGKWEYDGIS
jgi:hypothetical protein